MIIPELVVNDFQRSLDFYVQVLGFDIEYDRPEKKFAMLLYQGARLMINERNGSWETGDMKYPLGQGVNFEIQTDNADALLEALNENNMELYQEPEEAWYRKNDVEVGHKELLVQDPDGYLLRFAQSLGERSI